MDLKRIQEYEQAKNLRKTFDKNDKRPFVLELDKFIKNHEEELNKEPISDAKKLAILLHDLKCHWNHTDGCGWYYHVHKSDGIEIHDWDEYSHSQYLKQAEEMIKKFKKFNITFEEILEIVKIVSTK